MASHNKRKHPDLASWLATFKSPAPGETHGHGSDQLMQQAAATSSGLEASRTPEASGADMGGSELTLRQATKDTSTWLEYHRTPAEESGEADRDPRIPVFKLSHAGAQRHAAFICGKGQSGAKASDPCACPATDRPGKCTDTACLYYGAAKVMVPAFYRCPGSCRGAVLAPSLCYPIAASICEREDEPIFAVVGCESCEHKINTDSSGSLVLCGKACTGCIPVYVESELPTRKRATVLIERHVPEGKARSDTEAAALSDRKTAIATEDATASDDKETDEPLTKRAAQ